MGAGLENLPALRAKLIAVTDRLAGVEADLLNLHVDFPVFERLAKPVAAGRTKAPGIKIQDTERQSGSGGTEDTACGLPQLRIESCRTSARRSAQQRTSSACAKQNSPRPPFVTG